MRVHQHLCSCWHPAPTPNGCMFAFDMERLWSRSVCMFSCCCCCCLCYHAHTAETLQSTVLVSTCAVSGIVTAGVVLDAPCHAMHLADCLFWVRDGGTGHAVCGIIATYCQNHCSAHSLCVTQGVWYLSMPPHPDTERARVVCKPTYGANSQPVTVSQPGIET
jgi:hypothetical protein